MIGHHAALIYTMVMVSAADRNMTDRELRAIGEVVGYLPVFENFDRETLPTVTSACAQLLESEDGLDAALEEIRNALPGRLRETGYLLACEIFAADGQASREELRMLELLRDALDIDRLVAAALERSTRARFMKA
jgi:tellurite resistance protein